MTEKILTTVITFIVSGTLGYCVSMVKHTKTKMKASDQALLTLLQNTLTNTYFLYEKMEKLPDYVYRNWLSLLKAYENLGGNDYVHVLAKKMESWELENTGILNNTLK